MLFSTIPEWTTVSRFRSSCFACEKGGGLKVKLTLKPIENFGKNQMECQDFIARSGVKTFAVVMSGRPAETGVSYA